MKLQNGLIDLVQFTWVAMQYTYHAEYTSKYNNLKISKLGNDNTAMWSFTACFDRPEMPVCYTQKMESGQENWNIT